MASITFTNAGGIRADSDVRASGFTATSSRLMKENIKPTSDINALDLIDSVDIVHFNYINDELKTPHIGFIAEDTDRVFSTPHMDSMDMVNCIGVLMKAVQELKAENEELRKKVSG